MRRRRLPIPQREFGFTLDAFNLFAESTLDGDRITRERAEADRARKLAEAAQAGLFATNRSLKARASARASVSKTASENTGRV